MAQAKHDFVPDPDVTPLDSDQRMPRHARLLRGTISSPEMGVREVLFRNFSRHGVGGRTDAPLMVGDRIWVGLQGLAPIAATVRWVRNDRFGLIADQQIPFELLRARAAGILPTADDLPGEFRIVPPVDAPGGRPRLSFGGTEGKTRCKSDWISD